jgi:hypothetical protein
MAFSAVVRLRFKSFLPGAGYDASGAAKQGKTNTRGVITVTDYERGGTTLLPATIGLSTIDDLELKLREPVRSPDPVNNMREVVYSVTAQQFYVYEWRNDHLQFYLTGGVPISAQGIREVRAGTDFDVSWDAFGDAVQDVELT